MEQKDSVAQSIMNFSPEKIIAAAADLNGPNSWFRQIWMWRIRKYFDLLFSGQVWRQMRHLLRQTPSSQPPNYWQIENTESNHLLVLRSLMKLPGQGTLEVQIEEQTVQLSLSFVPRGALGRLYWMLSHPFHASILTKTLQHILTEAKQREQSDSS